MEIRYSRRLLEIFLPENFSGFLKFFIFLAVTQSRERRNGIPQI
jgi:hypothetical protein